ncbi:hypothetical protein WJX77_009009 [Trebouxia sp. C0004]
MSFWGTEVKPDKVVPFVPPPQDARLHISQACLAPGADVGAKSALKVKVQDGPELYVCRLAEGRSDFANLDLVLDEYAEFTVEGAALHITGYLMPEEQMAEEEEDEDDEMDEEYTPEMADELMRRGLMLGDNTEEYDSEGSDSDEDEEYGAGLNGIYAAGDSGDDEEESDDSDEADDGFVHRSSVIIEEVKDGQHDVAQITTTTAAKIEYPTLEDQQPAAHSSKKRKADPSKDTPATPHPKKQAKAEADSQEKLRSAPASAPAAVTTKQKKSDNAAAAVAPASQAAAVQKPSKAAAASAAGASQVAAAEAEAPLSKSQLKKQRKKAQEAGSAAAPASDVPVEAAPVPADSAPKKGSIQKWENGFQLERLAMGKPDGKLAKPGKKVVVKYKGSLASNGKVFDETKGNKTFSFRLGVGDVIKGWDRGVAGMRVGDKRKLTVPPQMAYGTDGIRGAIPPNATLNFSVELVDVK